MSYSDLIEDLRNRITQLLQVKDPETGAMLACTCKEELARYVRLGGGPLTYRKILALEYAETDEVFTVLGGPASFADAASGRVVIPGDPEYAEFMQQQREMERTLFREYFDKPAFRKQQRAKKKEARRQKQRWAKRDFD